MDKGEKIWNAIQRNQLSDDRESGIVIAENYEGNENAYLAKMGYDYGILKKEDIPEKEE